MKNKWNNILGTLLMADAGGTTDAGSGGGTSFITGTTGGSQVQNGAGNANTSSGATANQPTTDNTSGNTSTGQAATDWRSSLPKELQDDATIKKFSDVSTLAKSYLNAQKLIGADKIAVPTKHTTPEEMQAIYRKLGVPEKLEEYTVKFKEGASLDDKFSNDFKTVAHKAGIHPTQAQALADWFSEANMGAEQTTAKEMKQAFDQNVVTLKKEWGNSFDLNIQRANKVVNEIGGADVAKYLNDSGAGADKNVIKFLAKVGEQMYAEHKFVEGQGTTSTMDPKSIQSEINKIKANPAYYDRQHPSQKALVEEMKGLFDTLYAPKN